MSCPGLAPKSVGPYDLKVPPADAWQPSMVIVTVPYVDGHQFCDYIFGNDMGNAPYGGVSGTNVPDWMTIGSDGRVCSTRAMKLSEWTATFEGHEPYLGKLTATDASGRSHTWDVRYGAQWEPH